MTFAPDGSHGTTVSRRAFWVSNPIAPAVASTRQASGKARSPDRRASIRTWWRSEILDGSTIRTIGLPPATTCSRTSRANGAITSSLSLRTSGHFVAEDQRITEKAGDPLVAHVESFQAASEITSFNDPLIRNRAKRARVRLTISTDFDTTTVHRRNRASQ